MRNKHFKVLKRPFINIPSENRYHTRKMIKISILKEKTTMNLYRRGLLTDDMKNEPLFAEHLDKTIIANDIGRYFVRKVENIRNEIDATPISQSDRDLVLPDKPVVYTNVILRSFRNLSEQDIYDLIQKSAKKSCVLDPLPTTLVCDSLDVLLPVITKLVNTSLSTAHFPTKWKQVIVNPLLKKGAKHMTHQNLRPISNLRPSV